MARRIGTAASREQAEPVVQAGRDLLDRKHIGSRSGQFQGKRNAVQTTADPAERLHLFPSRQLQPHPGGGGALDEQRTAG
jgi:hypothetical protein